jgi:hypothetical protein
VWTQVGKRILPIQRCFRRGGLVKIVIRIVAGVIVALMTAWAAGAIYYSPLPSGCTHG